MELRQLEYVVGVVDHGTFTAAAAHLHVSQPTLSQGVATLERELGVELFHRVGRRAVLSAAGEAFVSPARQALRDAATAREAAESVRGLRSGHVEIAALPTLAVDPLAGWVGAFRSAHPTLAVRTVEPEDADSVVRLVADGTCELALAELPVPAGLVVVVELVQPIVAVASPAMATKLPAGRRVALERLAVLPLVTTPPGTSTRRLVEEELGRTGATMTIAVETANREAMVPMVLAGAGITFLPEALAGEAERRGARIIRPNPPLRRRVGLVHRAGPLSPAARAFVDVVTVAPR